MLRDLVRHLSGLNNLDHARPHAHEFAGVVHRWHVAHQYRHGTRRPGRDGGGNAWHRRQNARSGGGCSGNGRIGQTAAQAERKDIDHGLVVHDIRGRLITRDHPIDG